MKQTETIAAIATALSDSGIGIVRISGEDAIEIGNKVYKSKNDCPAIPFTTVLLWMEKKSWTK